MNRFCVRRNTIFFFEILLVRDQVGYAPHFTESIPTHSDFYTFLYIGTDDVRLCVRNTLRYVFNYDFFVTTII